jgi:hypothetical protein
MNKKKIPIGVGIVVIVIIAITIGLLVWKYEKSKPAQINQQLSVPNNKPSDNMENKNKVEIADNWTLVSHYNFWNNPEKFKTPNKNRFPGIKFSYPENWEFRCCNDMDFVSTHTIYSSKDRDTTLPFIRISNIGLTGCPKAQDTCSIDKTIKLTADEKFSRLIDAVSKDKVSPKIELKKLKTYAFVYEKTEKNGKFSKAYLINLPDGVVEIDFINYELLDEKFIENFLNRIEFEN